MSTISNITAAYTASTSYESKTTVKKDNTEKTTESSYGKEVGVVYEKSTQTDGTYKANNSALIQKMKADAENRTNQLRSLVESMMRQQGSKIGQADSIWSFLAGGNYTVSPEVKAQAQADIAEDGYWGVEQTSNRIVEFAKALSGGDTSKADELLEAFKKGYQQATGAWGRSLPSISSRTYDAVVKKFDEWKNGAAKVEE
ncbi:MAG: hypothetical protein HFI37_07495 [Lachnospiraceae bacterium]|nr:hypothetical protein [Lachnospiraceae bacterium]